MRLRGKVTVWKDDRGFGFIAPDGGGEDVFLHANAVPTGLRPRTGAVVTYELTKDRSGRSRAANVQFVGIEASEAVGTVAAGHRVLILGYLGGLAGGGMWRPDLWYALPVVAGLSLAAYLSYRADKDAARRSAWRISEATLHGLALFGGWPGALIAQDVLRHKTRKASFRLVFWLTVVLNVSALGLAATFWG